jgi:hypothetical protein
MMFKNLYIAYSNPTDPLDTFTLEYRLRDNSVVPKWCERIETAQEKYTIDAPDRFYGFGSRQEQISHAITQINNCIEAINKFDPIIDRRLKDINDQDTLNYLHHIFEVYHGLLDQQIHEFWIRAPNQVQRALADLNVLVHRCESVGRQALSRHVVTYYGLPKTQVLDQEDYSLFEDTVSFGTVYLNYVEIGKTLDDLAVDNDQYIGDDAFRPFKHHSADFNVKFWSSDDRQAESNRATIKAYYDTNREFFESKKLSWGHPYLASGSIPLADLQYTGNHKELLKELETHQWVKEVTLL